jgi:acetyl esterase/lipase
MKNRCWLVLCLWNACLAIESAAVQADESKSPAKAAAAVSQPSKNGPKWKKVLPETPPGVRLSTHVIATYPEHTVTLDVYMPTKPGVYPAILDIHGGGWRARQVESDKPMMERLAAKGFVTALVAYRLSGEAKYPAALDDCKAAVRYLRANAAQFQLDPQRIGVMGGSAGGHLSGLLAMTSGLPEFEGSGPNREQSSAVRACIVMAATMDLVAASSEKTSPGAVEFFGKTCAESPDVFRQASPITHVRKGVPLTIFIEGEKDSLKVGRSEMQARLRALGIETAVHTLKDAPHPFWMSQPWLDETVEIAATFFHRELGPPVAKP